MLVAMFGHSLTSYWPNFCPHFRLFDWLTSFMWFVSCIAKLSWHIVLLWHLIGHSLDILGNFIGQCRCYWVSLQHFSLLPYVGWETSTSQSGEALWLMSKGRRVHSTYGCTCGCGWQVTSLTHTIPERTRDEKLIICHINTVTWGSSFSDLMHMVMWHEGLLNICSTYLMVHFLSLNINTVSKYDL